MRTKPLFLLPLMILLMISCSKDSKTANFDYGKIEKNIYSNSFFNMKITLPDGWHFLTDEQNKGLMNKSSELLTKENNTINKNIEASKVTTALLLTALQYEVGTYTVFNPNMVIIAENLKNNPNVKSPADYLVLTRKTLVQTSQIISTDSISNVNINGTNLSTMRLISADNKTNANERIIQKYYVHILNKFAITAILTYKTEDQRLLLEQAISTLKFNKNTSIK